MAKDDKVNMPQSTAGITRYFDDFKSKIQMKPQVVVVIIVVVILIIIILKSFFSGWLA
jgi:preprotein translocase subunit Sec61beta